MMVVYINVSKKTLLLLTQKGKGGQLGGLMLGSSRSAWFQSYAASNATHARTQDAHVSMYLSNIGGAGEG